jgi:cobalt-zinc-cadmium efflux system protein
VVVILVGAWQLLRDSVNLAMDAVPEDIDPRTVQEYLTGLSGVVEVHDLHIWGMSTTEVALTVHLVRPAVGDEDALIAQACRELHERFGIEHATLQVERGGGSASCSCSLSGTTL